MADLSRFTSEEIRAELARRALTGRARRPQTRKESPQLLVTAGERLEEELAVRAGRKTQRTCGVEQPGSSPGS